MGGNALGQKPLCRCRNRRAQDEPPKRPAGESHFGKRSFEDKCALNFSNYPIDETGKDATNVFSNAAGEYLAMAGSRQRAGSLPPLTGSGCVRPLPWLPVCEGLPGALTAREDPS